MVLIKWTYLGNKVAGEKKVAKEDKPSLLRSIKMERLCSKNQWKKVQIEKFSLLVSEVKNQCFFLRKWISNCVALLRSEEMFSLFLEISILTFEVIVQQPLSFQTFVVALFFQFSSALAWNLVKKDDVFFYLVTKRILIFFFKFKTQISTYHFLIGCSFPSE